MITAFNQGCSIGTIELIGLDGMAIAQNTIPPANTPFTVMKSTADVLRMRDVKPTL
jgi:hypothetical protein